MNKCFAEFLGTFILVFAGTGAIVVNDVSPQSLTHVGISLTFGLVVMSLIHALGDISGAHLNPAVTVGFYLGRRFPAERVLPYVASQCLGAIAASVTLRVLFLEHPTLGLTEPHTFWWQAFVVEVILTAILMLVILGVSTGAKEKGILAGAAVGAVIAWEALMGGPISGASMNPARSLGPALISQHLDSLWIYLLAPILGAAFGVICWHTLQPREIACPPQPTDPTSAH